ncbi:MAG: hypothetical protein OES10_03140 [Gammaproteobacteria bacterium]|nr:hypothetical protein [Gammaproteobacteria bacterium]MDH3749034.1 hypothetical protein [Gammaproteobacteria bacterium]
MPPPLGDGGVGIPPPGGAGAPGGAGMPPLGGEDMPPLDDDDCSLHAPVTTAANTMNRSGLIQLGTDVDD